MEMSRMDHQTTVFNKGHTNVEVSPREELVLLALCNKELYGLQIPQAVAEAIGAALSRCCVIG